MHRNEFMNRKVKVMKHEVFSTLSDIIPFVEQIEFLESINNSPFLGRDVNEICVYLGFSSGPVNHLFSFTACYNLDTELWCKLTEDDRTFGRFVDLFEYVLKHKKSFNEGELDEIRSAYGLGQ